ncbi:MAG: type II toxin-antitoxin system VapB family antitoxin [Caldilineaceae bacterium]|nr:type II toxin-antitoxin system VapB family antitoxin [Caldilineaceae bacterium]
MTIQINNPEVEKLAQELINYTGESLQQAVTTALQERLDRERIRRKHARELAQQLLQIGRECAALPILDDRTPEVILGYNEQGLPS